MRAQLSFLLCVSETDCFSTPNVYSYRFSIFQLNWLESWEKLEGKIYKSRNCCGRSNFFLEILQLDKFYSCSRKIQEQSNIIRKK
jgi:hypothetical protein